MYTSRFGIALSSFVITALPFLVGCQAFDANTIGGKINPGNPDYRRASLESQDKSALDSAYCMPTTTTEKFGDSDSIRVSIRNAYLARTSEGSGLSEIAVLANVTVGNPISATEPLTSSRVVHYEEGVRTSEFLRFRDSAKLYGPISYNGGDLHFRLSVMELDEKDNARNTQVLKALAGVGSSAYPPSAPVLGVLEKIGTTILENNEDDIDFDFRFTLSAWPMGENANYISNWLTPGYFVVISTDDVNDKSKKRRIPLRMTDEVWDKLVLDIPSGELYWKDTVAETGGTRFSDASYIVVLVEKGFDSTEQDALETLAQLQEDLDAGIQAGSAKRDQLIEDIDNAAAKIKESLKSSQ